MVVSLGPSIAAELRKMLAAPRNSDRVRIIAAEALIGLDDLPAGETAYTLLQHSESSLDDRLSYELEAALLRLLARIGLPEHLDTVLRRLTSPHDSVRVEAAATIGAIGSAADVGLLLPLLEDRSQWVAVQAARAIRKLGGAAALRVFIASGHPRAVVAREPLAEAAA
jgi:HEAT repeat protein